jgi:hypothetical protein
MACDIAEVSGTTSKRRPIVLVQIVAQCEPAKHFIESHL